MYLSHVSAFAGIGDVLGSLGATLIGLVVSLALGGLIAAAIVLVIPNVVFGKVRNFWWRLAIIAVITAVLFALLNSVPWFQEFEWQSSLVLTLTLIASTIFVYRVTDEVHPEERAAFVKRLIGWTLIVVSVFLIGQAIEPIIQQFFPTWSFVGWLGDILNWTRAFWLDTIFPLFPSN